MDIASSAAPRRSLRPEERISVEQYRRLVSAVASGRRKARRRRGEEEALHMACVEWCGLHATKYPALRMIIHVPNGGLRPRGEAGKLKALGVKPGVPDLLLPVPAGGKFGLAVELKAVRGRLSPSQQEWLDALAAFGWHTAVVRSIDDFASVVESYLSCHRQTC